MVSSRRSWSVLLILLAIGCGGARGKPGHPTPDGGETNEVRSVPPASMNPAVANRGAEAQLGLLRAMPSEILEHLAHGGKPDEAGAVGHNRGGWMGAQYQRSAALYFLDAVSQNRPDAAEDAWRAFEVAFAHQEKDGGFGSRNESGTPSAMKDVYSDTAFFLAHFCQAVLVVRASPLESRFRERFEALRPGLRRAATLLAGGKDVLVAREASATNRYFIDALGYGLSGLLLEDSALEETGAFFVDLGLKKQQPEGFFEESGGADTSYNCVSILLLQIHDLYFGDPRHQAALAKATSWQLRHVQPDGEIESAGNSRTGLGQEKYFGKPKGINYPEAVLALLYYGTKQQNADALDAARRIYEHKLQHR